MRVSWTHKLAAALALAAVLGTTGCDGGSGGGSGASAAFTVESISVPEGSVWQINRPIRVRFSRPVKFSSVSLNSINIRKVGGANALGEFFLEDPQTVVFQPLCPTQSDFSDAALEPGGAIYELTVVGTSSNLGFTVESSGGEKLEQSERRTFSTPTDLSAASLFFDPVVGPPRPRVRGRDGVSLTELSATYVELGGDISVASRLYFEDTGSGIVLRDSSGQIVSMPLNLYSQDPSQIAILLYVNQPVSPSIGDAATGAVLFEYESTPGNWIEIPSTVELLANCTSTGALLRIEPSGVLPPSATTRVVMTTTFADLVDETNQAAVTDFAVADAAPAPTLGALADEIFADFLLSAEDDPAESLEDATAALADPPADWGNGRLAPGFDFDGTGGPLGDFDVEVPAGQSFVWSTSTQLLTGGPNFSPSQQITAFGGVFNVDDFRVEAGATLRFQGPNPVLILATGTVDIQGRILVNGGNNIGVVTLNTTNVPEEGASGQCGGGRGGTGSPLTNAHSVRGGDGFGPGDLPNLGGRGGEGGWSTNGANNGVNRRGAGGGGGVFGANQLAAGSTTLADERYIGLNAEPGFDGAMNFDATSGLLIGAYGTENPQNQESPPNGGGVGLSPFQDGDPTNDFFGRMVDPMTGQVIVGELQTEWAGSGGGGGGDASNVNGTVYPDPFAPGQDEKGAGGGGGGGTITILAIEEIRFGASGQIQCRGGHGGGGESTNFINRIGAGSGGGSGGHVILQSATAIDFSAKTSGFNSVPAILATGGQGGAGAEDDGGAQLGGEVAASADACHKNSPPMDSACPLGEIEGAGGDGGPGLVQLHTPLGLVGTSGDIVLPPNGDGLDKYCFPTPLNPLVPQFGRKSRARSIWLRLGEGGFDVLNPGSLTPPTFSFEGTDPLTGSILVNGTTIPGLPEIVPAATLSSAGTGLPFIAADEFTLVMSGVGVADELKSNPELLNGFLIDFDPVGTVGVSTTRFSVASAAYDATTDRFSLTVPMSGPNLTTAGSPGTADVRVRPTFFRVVGGGVLDQMPPNVDIQIMFEAAPEDPVTGGPDETDSSGMQSDISLLNMLSPLGGLPYAFVRFEVFFDVDKNNMGIAPGQTQAYLEFLRMPFQY